MFGFRFYRACRVVQAEAHAPSPTLSVGSRCAGESQLWGLGFRIQDLGVGCRAQNIRGLVCRGHGAGCRVWGEGCTGVQGSRFRVQRVQDSGFEM